jgi:hypothetical protein
MVGDVMENFVIRGSVESGGATDDPKIFALRLANDGVAIVLVQIDDPIIREEGPKNVTLNLA